MSRHRNPLPYNAKLHYTKALGYHILRTTNHIGRKYKTIRQIKNLLYSKSDIKPSPEADKQIFEEIFREHINSSQLENTLKLIEQNA